MYPRLTWPEVSSARHVPRVLALPASAEMLTNSHTIRPCPLINDPPNITADGEMRNTRLKCKENPYIIQLLFFISISIKGLYFLIISTNPLFTVTVALSAISNNSDVTA